MGVQSKRAALLAAVSTALLAMSAPALAAPNEQASAQADDVIVTAQRREETVFTVPTPVTAVSGETLRALGIEDLKSVINLVPNAVLPTSPDNYTLFINIRGIQQVDVQAMPNFGIYRNGIYAGGERPTVGSMVDVQRIEIVSGPQAGLYGRSAVGGAVNVIYATPGKSRGGYVIADAGNLDRIDLQGAFNLPVSETFAVRAAGWYQNQDRGRLYNAFLNKYVDSYRHDGGRLSARWSPDNKLSITWLGEYDQNRGPSVNAYAPTGVTNLTVRSAPETSSVIYRNTPDVNHNSQFYISQDLNYYTGFGRLQWLTSYSEYKMHDSEDQDRTALDPVTNLAGKSELYRHEGADNFYSELLWFSPEDRQLSYTVGGSYFNQGFDFARNRSITLNTTLMGPVSATLCARFLSNSACPGVPGGSFPALGLQTALIGAPADGTSIDTKSYSAFGQFKFRITNNLKLIGTLRYTDDEEHLNFHQMPLPGGTSGANYITALYANIYPRIDLVRNFRYTNWSPSVELQYTPTPNLNFYGLYSTGFRPGGFNFTTTSASLIPYGAETAKNYEVGVKSRWYGGRLQLNLDAFVMDMDNLLTYQPDPIAPPEFNFFYLNNVGSDRTYGVEFSGSAKPNPYWTLNGTLGWEHAKFTGGTSYGTTIENTNLQYVRTWTANLQSLFRYPLGGGYDLINTINWRYEKGGYLDISTIPWESLNRLDATIGLAHAGLSAVAYVNNASDDRPRQFVFGNGVTTLMEGRTYGVRAQFKY